MTKHIQWDGTLSQEGFDILKGEGGCIVCPTKSATSSWPATRLAWNASLKPKNVTATNQVSFFAEVWMNFVPLRNWILKSKPSTKNIGMKISCLVVSFLGVKMPMPNYKPSAMDVKNSWQMFVEPAVLSSNSVKLVSKSPKKCGKRRQNGLCLFS